MIAFTAEKEYNKCIVCVLFGQLSAPFNLRGQVPGECGDEKLNFFKKLLLPQYLIKDHLIQGPLPSGREAYTTFMKIALPALIEMVLISLISAADTIMVGGLGPYAIASVGLTGQPMMILLAFFFALNIGVTAIVARRKGEENQKDANVCLRQALMISGALSLVATAVAILLAEPMLMLAGAKADTLPYATHYFQIVNSGLIFRALSMTISAAQRGIGNTRVSLQINLTANIVNVCLNFLLIEGRFGFPALGVEGAAIATLIGNTVGFSLGLISILQQGGFLHISIKDSWEPHKEAIRAIVKIGGAAMLEQLALRIGFFLYARIVAELGTNEFATHQICMQALNLSFSMADGLGVAATSLVGQYLGAKRPDLSLVYGKVGQRLALLASVLLFMLFIFGRTFIVDLFTDDPYILQKGAAIMVIAAFIMPLQTSTAVSSGSLRGAGDTRYVAVTMLVSVGILRPLVSFILAFSLGLGLAGAWYAIIVDMSIRLFLLFRRFSSGKWFSIKV